MGGAITGAFSVTMPDADRVNASNHGDMPSAFVPLPALTAMATPSPGVMPRADRSSRKPLVANDSAAWPVSHRAATSGVIDDGATGEPPQENITTRVDDRMPELRVFTPPAPPDPPRGHGGGGSTEPSAPSAPPADGGALFGLLRPIGQVAGLTPGLGVGGGSEDPDPKPPNVIHNDDSATRADIGSGRDASNPTSNGRHSGDGGGVTGRMSGARKSNDAGGGSGRGRAGQSASGGHDGHRGGEQ
jgi:hypothetical protein